MRAEHCGVKWRPRSHLCIWTLIKRAPFPPISDIEHTQRVVYSVATDKSQLWKAPIVHPCEACLHESRVGYLAAWKELKSDPRGDWPECLITLCVNKARTADEDHKAGPVAMAMELSIPFNILFTASGPDTCWLIRRRGKSRRDAHSLAHAHKLLVEPAMLRGFVLTDLKRSKWAKCRVRLVWTGHFN